MTAVGFDAKLLAENERLVADLHRNYRGALDRRNIRGLSRMIDVMSKPRTGGLGGASLELARTWTLTFVCSIVSMIWSGPALGGHLLTQPVVSMNRKCRVSDEFAPTLGFSEFAFQIIQLQETPDDVNRNNGISRATLTMRWHLC